MKVEIISDTHDRLDRIEKAVSIFNENGIELLLHAGDFVSPFFLSYLKDYDLIVYGHTHNLDIRQGSPLIINPGDASRWLGKATSVILDIDSMKPEVFNL